MTETKYILTGDEPHWTGEPIREFYAGAKFPLVVTYLRESPGAISDVYCDVDDPHVTYYVGAGTPVKAAAGGKVEYAFVGKDGERINMPTPVSGDFGFDPVDKPEHYNTNLPEGVEAIDIIAAQTEHLSGLRAVCHANLLKYALRWQKKNGVEDLRKMVFYANRLIEEIENV